MHVRPDKRGLLEQFDLLFHALANNMFQI
jgi:hypothetical protein